MKAAWKLFVPPLVFAALAVTTMHFIGAWWHGGELVGAANNDPSYLIRESFAGFSAGLFWLLPLAAMLATAPGSGGPVPKVKPHDMVLPGLLAGLLVLLSCFVPLLPLGFAVHGVVMFVLFGVLVVGGWWTFRSRVKLPILWELIANLQHNQNYLTADRHATLAALGDRLDGCHPPVNNNEALVLLLYGLFSQNELSDLLNAMDSALIQHLPEVGAAISPLERCSRAGTLLRHRGIVGEDLFAWMVQSKQGQAELIMKVRGQCLGLAVSAGPE